MQLFIFSVILYFQKIEFCSIRQKIYQVIVRIGYLCLDKSCKKINEGKTKRAKTKSQPFKVLTLVKALIRVETYYNLRITYEHSKKFNSK